MEKTKTPGPARSLVCEHCEHPADGTGEPRTFYVHLQNGTIVPVRDVTDLEVTDTSIVLIGGPHGPVSYPRDDVYFACCDGDIEPPQF